MKFIDLFKLATRMFRARTSRTLLTILGISIGIAAILFLVSLGYGLQKTLLEKITTADSLLTLEASEAKSGVVSIDNEMIENIKKIPGVSEISPAFQMTVQGHMDDFSIDMQAIGTKASFLRLGGNKVVAGDLITDDNVNDIVIDNTVAQVLNENYESIIGKEMTFSFFVPVAKQNITSDDDTANRFSDEYVKCIESDRKYRIVGIVEGENNVVYINIDSLENLDIQHYEQVKVKAHTSQDMGIIRDTLLDYGLLVSSLSDTIDQANQIFRIIQVVLMLFGIIALIVSAIGMFNTMTVTLLERTEEIGIMKSIGASDASISAMFFMESTIMGFLGGCVGIFIGWVGGIGFNAVINFAASKFGGQSVNLFYSPPWFVLSILVFSAIVGILTGFVPARRASKIDPLDALRYK
jgi:ABC-type antimicrobial peptide transport system permease subunit